MSGLLTCLCAFALIWAAFSVIGALFRRRGGGFGGGYNNGYGNGFGGGFGGGLGGLLGGLGLGWMVGNMFNSGAANDSNVIDGETWGTDQVSNDTQIEDNGGGWDSGEWSGGDDFGGGDGGGDWGDA